MARKNARPVPSLTEHEDYRKATEQLEAARADLRLLNERETEIQAALAEAAEQNPIDEQAAYIAALDGGTSTATDAKTQAKTLRDELTEVVRRQRIVRKAMEELERLARDQRRMAGREAWLEVRPDYMAAQREILEAAERLAELCDREHDWRQELLTAGVQMHDGQTHLWTSDFRGGWDPGSNNGGRLGRLIHELRQLTQKH